MLLFHTGNLKNYGLEQIFSFAKEAGYDGLELEINRNYDTQDPEYLKKLEKRYKIKIKAFTIQTKKEEILFNAFQKTVREFPETTLNLISSPVLAFKYKKWMENIIPKLARKYQLKVNRKNIVTKMVMGFIPQNINNTLPQLKNKGGVCLDLSAAGKSGENIMHNLAFLGPKLRQVYLSNIYRGQFYHLPQTGILPVESFLTKLAKSRFKGDFTVRIQPKFMSQGEPEVILKKMVETREYFEKYFVKELEKKEQK